MHADLYTTVGVEPTCWRSSGAHCYEQPGVVTYLRRSGRLDVGAALRAVSNTLRTLTVHTRGSDV